MITRRILLGAATTAAFAGTAQSQNSLGPMITDDSEAAHYPKKPKIAITGDMGKVGGRLKPLLSDRFEIAAIDKRRGEPEDLRVPSLRWMHAMSKADAVVHLAWDTANYNSREGAMYNIQITQSALISAYHLGAKRFIFASSAWAGGSLYGGKTDNVPAIYVESKLFIEKVLADFAKDLSDMPITAIRFGQVHGIGTAKTPDSNFDGRIVMTDTDISGLFDRALIGDGFKLLGPFDAR